MFTTYLRNELLNRKKQTVIIAAGMALAIALVVIVSSIASGVKDAQASVLQSVYGVGTDITVTKTAAAGSGGKPSFSFGSDSGSSSSSDSGSSGSSSSGSGTKTDLDQSTLSVARGKSTLSSTAVTKAAATSGVSAASGVLELTENSFSGSITSGSGGTASSGSTSAPAAGGTSQGSGSTSSGSTSSGSSSSGGFGGGNFSFDETTVDGVSTAASSVGPLTSTTVSSGRTLRASDAGTDNVVLDKTYAKSESKKVGDTVTIGGTKFTVVGIVASTSSSSTTAANMYIPLDTAQKLSSETGKVTTIYVSATSSSDVSSIKTALTKKISGATVSTEADLASSVSGSLSTASSLVSNLGTWLSIVVLAAAFLIAILFTISGVTRRTREFGTLKAIGWSNGRITRQVAGESLVQGIIGGIIGAAAGLIGILVVNIINPTISGGSSATAGAQGGPGGATTTSSAASDITLHAPVTVEVILLAIGLAVVGGLLAGGFGGWRASRLRPAAALRSVG
jgi:putative ABC transport system permease protein